MTIDQLRRALQYAQSRLLSARLWHKLDRSRESRLEYHAALAEWDKLRMRWERRTRKAMATR